MKKTFFNNLKSLFSIFSLLLLWIFCGCSDLNMERQEEKSSALVRVHFSLPQYERENNRHSRAASFFSAQMPDADHTDLIKKITVTAVLKTPEEQKIDLSSVPAENKSINKIFETDEHVTAAAKFKGYDCALVPGEWDFNVTASLWFDADEYTDAGESRYMDYAQFKGNKTISANDDKVEISLNEIEDGVGVHSLKFDIPSPNPSTGSPAYFRVTRTLSKLGAAEPEEFTVTKFDNTVTETQILPAGLYIYRYRFYSELNTLQCVKTCIFRITPGCETTGTYTIASDSLNTLYKINYDLNGGSFVAGSSPVKEFTKSQTVTLPDETMLHKDGYIFNGWYTSNSCFAPDKIEGWAGGKYSSDATLYAGWLEDSGYIYVKSDGVDAEGRGTLTSPYNTVQYALQQLENKTQMSGSVFLNKICILDDITVSAGMGISEKYCVEISGAKDNGTDPVTITLANGMDQSALWLDKGQKVYFKNITFTSEGSVSSYSVIGVQSGEVTLDNCTISDINSTAKVSALSCEGDSSAFVIKNSKIKGNKATKESGSSWTSAVFIKSGKLTLDGTVEISGNKDESENAANLYLGDSENNTYTKLILGDDFDTASKVGIAIVNDSGAITAANTPENTEKAFESDNSGFMIKRSASGEVQLVLKGTEASAGIDIPSLGQVTLTVSGSVTESAGGTLYIEAILDGSLTLDTSLLEDVSVSFVPDSSFMSGFIKSESTDWKKVFYPGIPAGTNLNLKVSFKYKNDGLYYGENFIITVGE